jgi:hypothetical protein
MRFLSVFTSITALAALTFANPVALSVPAGKPTGGPASASITVYSGPATCADPNSAKHRKILPIQHHGDTKRKTY